MANGEPIGSASDVLKSTSKDSLGHAALQYAIKGVLYGSLVFALLELCLPHWIPITRWSMATMFVAEALLGEVTMVTLRSDLPWLALIPVHCVLTFAVSVGWIFVNGWQSFIFHEGLALYIAVFVVIYACVWLITVLYSRLVTDQINRNLDKLVAHANARNNDASGDIANGPAAGPTTDGPDTGTTTHGAPPPLPPNPTDFSFTLRT
ncbi:DUF3021 domain-containing protein [Bifidobacterium sp. ESL0763]|uniref:DUF3021 domain-containing protein n=1 Tax=Bifidobacterium sp. ESL0763 TaxID=2983227 RepID=UPI0023F980CC|nr:DUF3021 domain-containing protein [Bifidobacterium sp. ESL0763]MDF7663369.1 DUF3021 domain-containing protein [Bifidobacterium sp. ESL0763]